MPVPIASNLADARLVWSYAVSSGRRGGGDSAADPGKLRRFAMAIMVAASGSWGGCDRWWNRPGHGLSGNGQLSLHNAAGAASLLPLMTALAGGLVQANHVAGGPAAG